MAGGSLGAPGGPRAIRNHRALTDALLPQRTSALERSEKILELYEKDGLTEAAIARAVRHHNRDGQGNTSAEKGRGCRADRHLGRWL